MGPIKPGNLLLILAITNFSEILFILEFGNSCEEHIRTHVIHEQY